MRPRLSVWWLIAIVLLAVIYRVAPQQLPVALYKLSLLSLAGIAGYWLDRHLFPYARPDGYLNAADWREWLKRRGKSSFEPDVSIASGYQMAFCTAMLRRALVVAACVVGVALGV